MFDQDDDRIHEPTIDPLADTNPSLSIRPVREGELAGWRRGVGFLSLLLAAGLTAATAILLMTPNRPPAPGPIVTATTDESQTVITVAPTDVIPPTNAPTVIQNQPNVIPTASNDVLANLLKSPPVAVNTGASIQVVRDTFNPFTIIPDRPRNEVIQYTAVQGDTIYTIAERFKLKPETIAWSNPRRIIEVLRPGDVINILPVDGVYHQVVGSKTIAEIATMYSIKDPYTIIDSEYNTIGGAKPDQILASGTWLVIPGGQAEQITWNPGVKVEASGARKGFVTQFAPGQPGSCGEVQNPGGGAGWRRPLASYTFIRGFSSWHSGVDLAAPIGTPVMAANSGAVIFAGWNSYGYGNTVVLAHGPFLTLYGHMSSISVGCRQYVTVGQVVGAVGSTGNSSGPHLHFEIRSGETPTDPTATMGF
jgi:murein DD-endopeptidase MepM/ murein hydrolase activator NlpD